MTRYCELSRHTSNRLKKSGNPDNKYGYRIFQIQMNIVYFKDWSSYCFLEEPDIEGGVTYEQNLISYMSFF